MDSITSMQGEYMKPLILDLPPTLNHSYAYTYRSGHARSYKTTKATKWQEDAVVLTKGYMRKNNLKYTEGPVALKIHLYYKFNRDVDGSNKLIMDALEGVLYKNDRQVNNLLVMKDKDVKNPRMEVEFIL